MLLPKKLIEVALPLPEINDASAYDKMPGVGAHPKGIHQWWARLPLPVARAILFASVVDDPSIHPEKWRTEKEQDAERERLFGILRRMMEKALHKHPEVYAEAHAEMLKHTDGKLPAVLDPFSGGGSIPLEANRLGFEAHAYDLNPVAVLLNKCNLELAPRWAGRAPINPDQRKRTAQGGTWRGVTGLAEDVRHYGRIIRERAIAKIGYLYPKVGLPRELGGGEADVIAWLWARTIKCSNPICGARAPLIRSFWLSKKKPKLVHARPILDQGEKTVRFIPSMDENVEKETTSGKGARCLFCGTSFRKSEVRDLATQHGVQPIPLAVVADGPKGRCYLPSNAFVNIEVPITDAGQVNQPMTNDRRWFSPPLYGLPNFADIFTPRQLTAMVTLSDLVKEIGEDIRRDTIAAELSLTETDAYAQTVTTFLALALDRCGDFNCGLSTWKPSGQQQMHLFTRQAIPMAWDFAEANILGQKAICWHNAVEITADAIETLLPDRTPPGIARQIDAATGANGIRDLLVSTDPPYYDNIGYAALSDFFYVWLRRTVGPLYPELFGTMLVPKMPELTASSEKFDGNRQKAKEHFESGFRKTFSLLREKMDARFPLTVYYAFKQDDEEGGDEEFGDDANNDKKKVDLTTGWETLLEALISSGFQITATWPVRAAQKWRMVSMGTNALASYIVLACRPRMNAERCNRREFLRELKQELPAALRHLQQGNIAPVDFAQAAIGPGMAIYSKYTVITDASGAVLTVRDALREINRTLTEVLTEQDDEFDNDTRWAVAWYEQAGFAEGEFDQATVLARAKVTSVNGVKEAGIVTAGGGKVRLLRPVELPKDWTPETDRRLTVWEMTHHLVRVYHAEKGGDQAAADLLKKLGTKGELARDLAYRLFNLAERKKATDDALGYNSLVLGWPEIARLARESKPVPLAQGEIL